MSVRWSDRALLDLEEIDASISRDDTRTAASWVSRLQASVARLEQFPKSGRIVPELARDDVREVIKGNYRLVYQLTRAGPVIITVFESRRALPEDAEF